MEMEEKMESMNDYAKELDQSFRKISEGDILTGTVIGIGDVYIALDLKYYTQGIIRLEDFSDDPRFSARQDVKLGDEISATVISTDDGKGNILLSRKIANHIEAWEKLKKYQEQNMDLEITIAEAVKSGVVAYLEDIRGFITASKLDLSYVEEKDLPEYVVIDLGNLEAGGSIHIGSISWPKGVKPLGVTDDTTVANCIASASEVADEAETEE